LYIKGLHNQQIYIFKYQKNERFLGTLFFCLFYLKKSKVTHEENHNNFGGIFLSFMVVFFQQ